MIHYHGTPISGAETVGATVLRNRHGFVSFAAPQHLRMVAEVCSSFALDNGAFSMHTKGVAVDWNKYYEFVHDWHKHPGFDFALIPDVIDGTVQQNQELMGKWPFSRSVGVPVWHLHEPLHWLVFLCQGYPRVAIGSSGEYWQVGSASWWARMAEAMGKICDGSGRPMCKLHGLRMLDPKIFTKFPFSSCDSTNVAVNCANSNRWKNYPPPNNETRGIVLAERIEAHTSASAWENKKLADQQELFSAL